VGLATPAIERASGLRPSFVSPHLYPKAGKAAEEIKLLQQFDWGKPIVVGETFPLHCSADDECDFLLQSRAFAQGWMGHWPNEPPGQLVALKKSGQANIQNAIWLSWVDLFRKIGPQMLRERPEQVRSPECSDECPADPGDGAWHKSQRCSRAYHGCRMPPWRWTR
jgi:hypothetical protein